MNGGSGGSSSRIQYTTIDFQKTAAIASTAKAAVEPSQDGVRKTRHDSKAENLE